MKRTLKHFAARLKTVIVLVLLVATNANAQSDLLGAGQKSFNASGTLNGTYTTTYKNAEADGLPFVQEQTASLDVTNAKGAKVATVSVTLNNYDVTFTVSGSTAKEDGTYTFTVPQGYFYCDVFGMVRYDCSADKFTINLTGTGTGTGGGGGTTVSGEPKTVVFDVNSVNETSIEGLTFNRGMWSNTYGGFIVNPSYPAVFEAPAGLVITSIVLTAPEGKTVNLACTPEGATLNAENTKLTWIGGSNQVRFTKSERDNSYIASATVTFSSEKYAPTPTTYTIVFDPADLPGAGATLNGETYTEPVKSFVAMTEDDVVPATVTGYQSAVTKTTDANGNVTFTVTYTEMGPFVITRDMISPNPDVSITLAKDPDDPMRVPGLDIIRINAPQGISFVENYNGVDKNINISDRSRKAKVFSYSNQIVINISMGSGTISNKGKCKVTIPAKLFETIDGRANEPFTVTFYVGIPTPAEGDLNEDTKIDAADVEILAKMVLDNVNEKTVGKVAKLIRTVITQ